MMYQLCKFIMCLVDGSKNAQRTFPNLCCALIYLISVHWRRRRRTALVHLPNCQYPTRTRLLGIVIRLVQFKPVAQEPSE